jgi:hypothetical protein
MLGFFISGFAGVVVVAIEGWVITIVVGLAVATIYAPRLITAATISTTITINAATLLIALIFFLDIGISNNYPFKNFLRNNLAKIQIHGAIYVWFIAEQNCHV